MNAQEFVPEKDGLDIKGAAPRLVDLVLPVIEAHCARHGLKNETFGHRAVDDITLIRRLREGRVTLRIAQRALDYVAAIDGAAINGADLQDEAA